MPEDPTATGENPEEPVSPEGEDPKGDGGKAGDDPGDGNQEPEKKFTQADIDRIVSKAHDKWESSKQAEIEAERKKAEQAKLEAEGKWKELAKAKEEELAALNAQVALKEFESKATGKIVEAGLGDFADLILKPVNSVEDVERKIEILKTKLEEKVQASVKERLTSGRSPGSGVTTGVVTSLKDLKTDAQKSAYIREHGTAKYQELVEASLGED